MTSVLEPFSEGLARGHDPTAITTTFPPLDFTNLLTFENGLQPTSSPTCGFVVSPFSSARRFNPIASPSVITENLFLDTVPFLHPSSAKQNFSTSKLDTYSNNATFSIHQTRIMGEQDQRETKLQEQNIQSSLQEPSPMTYAGDILSQNVFIGNGIESMNKSFDDSASEKMDLNPYEKSRSSSSIDFNVSQDNEEFRKSRSQENSQESFRSNEKSTASDKTIKATSSIDKAAERRRKNRESSSRCYYNRKRIIEKLEKQISAEKAKLTDLYDRALELRHSNAKLKRDVVTRGLNLPLRHITQAPDEDPNLMQLTGYLNFMKSSYYRTVL